MSTQAYYTLLTAAGAAEWTNAQALGHTVPVTHMAVGDGNGDPVLPTEAMTALVHEVHRLALTSVTVDSQNPNWLIFETVIPATVGGWTLREIGLIGGAGAGGKLLAVGNFPATYKPVLAEGAAKDIVIRLIVQVANANVVQLTVDPSVVVATHQSVANAVKAHNEALDAHPQFVTEADLAVALLANRARRSFFASL